jgi:hypothetical protein
MTKYNFDLVACIQDEGMSLEVMQRVEETETSFVAVKQNSIQDFVRRAVGYSPPESHVS